MEGFQSPHRNDYRPSGFQVRPLQALGYISNINIKLFYLCSVGVDSNHRPSAYETDELPLLYPAIYFKKN